MSLPRGQTRQNLRTCSLDGILATPWAILSVPGSFLIASLLNTTFVVGPFWFGIIVAMPALANALSILLVPLVGRFLGARDMALNLSAMNVGIWLSGILGIAFLPAGDARVAGLFFVCLYFMLASTHSVAGVGWTAWVLDFIPDRIRGRYMGRRNFFTNFSTLSFMGVSLLALRFFEGERWIYLLLIGLAVLGRSVSVFLMHRIVSRSGDGGRIASESWFRDLARLRGEPGLLRFILFGSVAGFGMGFLGAVAPLHAFISLGVTPTDLTAYSIAATLAGTASVKIWGELIDRHGGLPVLLICAVAWRIGDLGWLVLTEQTKHGLFLVWSWGGVMGTGYMLASFILLLKFIPDGNRSAGISLNLTCVSTLAALAPILAGAWLSRVDDLPWDRLLVYRATLGVGFLVCAAATLCLWGLKEPKTHPERNTIHGALRTLRQLGVHQGLAFFGNLNFTVRRKK